MIDFLVITYYLLPQLVSKKVQFADWNVNLIINQSSENQISPGNIHIQDLIVSIMNGDGTYLALEVKSPTNTLEFATLNNPR